MGREGFPSIPRGGIYPREPYELCQREQYRGRCVCPAVQSARHNARHGPRQWDSGLTEYAARFHGCFPQAASPARGAIYVLAYNCLALKKGRWHSQELRMNIKKLFDLSGRVAIITGGSVGLGRQIAEGRG